MKLHTITTAHTPQRTRWHLVDDSGEVVAADLRADVGKRWVDVKRTLFVTMARHNEIETRLPTHTSHRVADTISFATEDRVSVLSYEVESPTPQLESQPTTP